MRHIILLPNRSFTITKTFTMKKQMMTMALVLGFVAFSFAQKMGSPVLIKSAGKPIDDKIPYAGPTIYDLDKDGKDDLIVGTFKGKFKFYKNTGTSSNPKYDGFEYIQAGGKDAEIRNW